VGGNGQRPRSPPLVEGAGQRSQSGGMIFIKTHWRR
jgi:hypothetical protein